MEKIHIILDHIISFISNAIDTAFPYDLDYYISHILELLSFLWEIIVGVLEIGGRLISAYPPSLFLIGIIFLRIYLMFGKGSTSKSKTRHIPYSTAKRIRIARERENVENMHKARKAILEQSAITPDSFFKMRKIGGRSNPTFNVAGIYVLRNVSNERHYVGQSINISDRVYAHFKGRGNQDVYYDYSRGQPFSITLIPLSNSGFSDLDALERHAIRAYSAYSRGYNRTRGNGWRKTA